LTFRTLEKRPLRCFEKSETDYPVTRHHIPKEQNPQLHRYENLRTVTESNSTPQKYPAAYMHILLLLLLQYSTFIYLCIASVSLKYNQQDATFSRSIYFYKFLNMFQAVPPPIIRSTKLYIQRQILSNQYFCLLVSWMRWSSIPRFFTIYHFGTLSQVTLRFAPASKVRTSAVRLLLIA
jgi:hypothetical protein